MTGESNIEDVRSIFAPVCFLWGRDKDERHREEDETGSKWGSSGNKCLGEGSSCFEMKLNPQVCQSETISGRVFSLSYK